MFFGIRKWLLVLPLLSLVYLPFVGGGLLTDDYVHLERVASVQGAADVLGRPDAFQFYRPVAQLSLALELALHGESPAAFRAVNVALHAAVIGMALLVARLILVPPWAATRAAATQHADAAAVLTAIVFAMTPKAHPIAVLWISARPELLMGLFSFAAVAAWIVWSRGGRTGWLVAAAAAYALAAFSKESAFLLPLVLLVAPEPRRPWKVRLMAGAALLAVGVGLFAWRSHVGALAPISGDAHYGLMTGLVHWWRGGWNYAGRMIVTPLALVMLVGLAWWRAGRSLVSPLRAGIHPPVVVFALAWIGAFIGPVLPIAARSELYLYLPVFGFALLAGSAAGALLDGIGRHRAVILVSFFVMAVGAYQASRSAATHRTLEFSARLMAALQAKTDLAHGVGSITIIPSDGPTERLLQDSIGGYLPTVLRKAFPGGLISGGVQYAREEPRSDTRRIVCEYRVGEVILRDL